MPTPVTVQSAHSTTVTLTFNSSANASLAQYVAAAIQSGIAGGSVLAEASAYGSPPSIPVGKTGEWVETAPTPTTLTTRYDYIVDASTTTANITGPGDSNVQVIAGSGNLTFNPALGSGTLIAGDGNDNFTVSSVSSGAWNIYLGDGADTVKVLNGGNDTISTGVGHDSLLLGSGNSTVSTSGTDTITGTTGAETVTASGTDLVYGGASRLNFLSTAGGATVYGGTGSDTVTGSTGPDYFQGGSGGNNSLTAGSGAATLIGGGSGDQLFANGAGAQILYAGSGNETLTGSSASGAQDTFVGSGGASSVVASQSATKNVFAFIDGSAGGSVFVTGLNNINQVDLHLSGYGADNISDVASQNNNSGNLNIVLTDGTHITFTNVTSPLTGTNFS